MCGISGFIQYNTNLNRISLENIIGKMIRTLIHRGPDDEGVWADEKFGIALGHRRLSIIDLSEQGRQPMISATGRYVIVFNGEIYNFRSLKKELEFSAGAVDWRGHSDTEVMLSAFETWGFEKSLERFNGMFAFALWDRQDKILYLARDRFGKKPLYYGWMGKSFLFGSELKALICHPDFENKINRGALTLYARFGYIPSPYSIFEGIEKLPQASFIAIKPNGDRNKVAPVCYWPLPDIAGEYATEKFKLSDDVLTENLETLLLDAVKIRMESDVPLGAFLSGGIDSSTVAALMQAQSAKKIKTFSIGFHEDAYNEADFAKKVAMHLGTDHTELYVTSSHALSVIPKIPEYYDEPFSDPSQVPTYLISEMTKKYVTVALSGDGGDELFAGYNRYFWGEKLCNQLKILPISLRTKLSKVLLFIRPSYWDKLFALLPLKNNIALIGQKIHKLGNILLLNDRVEIYRRLISLWDKPGDIVLNSSEPDTLIWSKGISERFPEPIEYMQIMDMLIYLPDDILVKVDRASMAVSLEIRAPLLDYRVAEFSLKLPLNVKIRGDKCKWLLRKVLCKYIPEQLIERPKMGFGVPIDIWLCGPLRDWAESLINEKRLKQEGYFNADAIRQRWRMHLNGMHSHNQIWNILMFQAWLDKYKAA